MVRALIEVVEQIDIRDVLPSVRVPTLVVHVDGDRVVPVEAAEQLAEGIPGARMVRFPGVDHNFWLVDGLIDEIERFVTGAVRPAEPTEYWRPCCSRHSGLDNARGRAGRPRVAEVLESHDNLVDRTVLEHGGRVVKHIGDGALSAFDGPAMAMRCAETMRERAAELGIELRAASTPASARRSERTWAAWPSTSGLA